MWENDYPWECGQLCRYDFWESATFQDVQAEIDGGADLNARSYTSLPGRRFSSNPLHRTPLQLAVEQENRTPGAIRLLLENGADPNPRRPVSSTLIHRTPLQLAVEQDNRTLGAIHLLLEYGADPNPPTDSDFDGESPLYHVSRLWYESDREIIEILLDYGADINSRSSLEGLTPLHRAIIGDADLDLIEMFLERGADINTRTSHGNTKLGGDSSTILHSAAEYNPNPEAIATLLDRGMDINVMAGDGSAPLHSAVERNENIAIVELLLKRGAEVDARDEDGKTPLHWAIRTIWNRDLAPQLMRLLLNYGADPAAKNIYGDSSLHMTRGKVELARLLLDSGADAGAVNNKGETILHRAFMSGPNFEFTELLLSRGANANGSDADGHSVLHGAIGYNADADIIELLLKYDADVTAITGSVVGGYRVTEDWAQATPLH